MRKYLTFIPIIGFFVVLFNTELLEDKAIFFGSALSQGITLYLLFR